MDIKTEQQIVEAAKTNHAAFGKLFDAYYPRISQYVLRRVGEVAPAQDITSVVFLKAWQGLHTYEWRGLPFSAWLYRIAGNEVNSYFRHRKLWPISLDALFEEVGFELADDRDIEQECIAYEDELARHQDFVAVQQIMLGLHIKYQEVLALRFFERMPIKQIALVLNKKENTVKSLLKRGTEQVIRNFSERKAL
ncbi:MAG TPA: sigma-70 family RNA polymerase sigma factor [Candidatus Saccharimonadales bacterium]|nr:sigma-70 family RNA polymerase sigma factor [Candidatus Saccharimonadales bacterium]